MSERRPVPVPSFRVEAGREKRPWVAFVLSVTVHVVVIGLSIFDFATGQTRTMDCMIAYTILSTTDLAPPTVTGAAAVTFPLNLNKQFGLNTNKVDVTFNEPVELASSQVTTNYALTGPVSRSIIDATRDPAATNVVHLTLGGNINANVGVYNLTVTGVSGTITRTQGVTLTVDPEGTVTVSYANATVFPIATRKGASILSRQLAGSAQRL